MTLRDLLSLMALIWHAEAWKADYSIDTALLNHFHFNAPDFQADDSDLNDLDLVRGFFLSLRGRKF